MARFTTHIQEIAVSCAFAVMGESRISRTQAEYKEIAARLPPLKVLSHKINEFLRELHQKEGSNLPLICRFKAGDRTIKYERYPKSISSETLRAALNKSGMRAPRGGELTY